MPLRSPALPWFTRRRDRRLAGTAVVACLSVLVVAGPASAASSAGTASSASAFSLVRAVIEAREAVRYVALGDSYSSGLGAGSYLASGGSCDRSADAYPQLWATAHDPASFASAACSGATTGSVISGQLSALSRSTTLVSITIGGNDVGFSAVMAACVLLPTRMCVSAIRAAEAAMSGQLPGELDSVLAAIAAAAPRARVVVLGYPQLYDLAGPASCDGLSSTDRVDLDAAASELDGQIQAAADRHGDTFADVRTAFAGHQICDPASWLHALSFPDVSESYHPTASGQADGYEPVFSAAAG